MKTKDKQLRSSIFRICRPAVILLMLCLALLLTPQVSAENDNINENYNLIEQYSSLLGEEINYYTELDTTAVKGISKSVTEVINRYRKELLDLQSHEDADTRLLEREIALAYTKGVSAGRLSWIYYYNTAEISEPESLAELETVYRQLSQEIDAAKDSTVLEPETNGLCNSLNYAVYKEKLNNLYVEGDSVFSKAIISGAIEDIEYISSPDIFGQGYSAVFDKAAADLILQRGRDGLSSQMTKILELVCPDEDLISNDHTSLLVYKLQNASALSEMNEAMRVAIRDLTALPESQSYSYIYINKLNTAVTETALRASTAGKAGDFFPLFKSYTLDRAKAQTKDDIAQILLANGEENEELKRIETLFNKDGAIIDLCENTEELIAERSRAEYRKQLYSEMISAKDKLAIIIGPYDTSAFLERIDKQYSTSTEELDALSKAAEGFVENCNKSLESAKSGFTAITNEAKAERFLQDNKQIIKKSLDQMSVSDEFPLRSALTSYISLPQAVREILNGQINSLVEKYKSVLNSKIRSLCKNDAFYLDICEKICVEMSALPSNDIAVFYNNCDLVFNKADVLCEIVSYYREICAESTYQSYTDDEKKSLSALCSDAADQLKGIDISDSSALDTHLTSVFKNTIISIDRINQYARVRAAARGSTSLSVEKLLVNAQSVINASSDRTEMIAHADNAVFKIERVLTVETVISNSEKAQYIIQEMKFLTPEEKILYSGKIDSLKKNMADQAGVAENITVLSFVWTSFTEELADINADANSLDLGRAITNYTDLIEKELDALKTELGGMAHISAQRRDELIASLVSLVAKFKTDAAAAADSGAVASVYTASLEQMAAVQLAASKENLEGYKLTISAELDKLDDNTEIYSETRIEEIRAIIEIYKQKLSACPSIADCSALLDTAKAEAAKVNDLLDDAKEAAAAALAKALEECRAASSLYSAENLALTERLCNEALNKISEYKSISDIDALNSYLAEAIALIKAVRRDIAYSAGSSSAMTNDGAAYPLGYDLSKGYWGSVYASDGIMSDAVLSIGTSDISSKSSELQKLIRKAAKNGSLSVTGNADDETLRLLRHCVISLGLNVELSPTDPSVNSYTLSMLLPSDLSDENILGLAFTDSQGNVEFYPISQKDMLITARLTHFSEYYLLCERTVDLTALIVFLMILLVFEIVIFCFVLFLRYKRRRKETDMLPPSFMYSFTPMPLTFALRVKPEGGVGLVLTLTVAALALACGTAFLLRAELPFLRPKKRDGETRSANIVPAEPKALAKKDSPRLKKSHSYLLHAGEEHGDASVGCAVMTEEDEDIIYEEEPSDICSEPLDEASALHRAEVNLDVIAQKFREGDLVDLAALKRKRLVSRRTDYVKILARGALTKPFIVEAQDFSRAAEEMLKAVGGEAIRVEVKKDK